MLVKQGAKNGNVKAAWLTLRKDWGQHAWLFLGSSESHQLSSRPKLDKVALSSENRSEAASRVGGTEMEANTLFRIERIKMTASLGLHPRAGFAIEPYHRARDYAANSERDETQERLC